MGSANLADRTQSEAAIGSAAADDHTGQEQTFTFIEQRLLEADSRSSPIQPCNDSFDQQRMLGDF